MTCSACSCCTQCPAPSSGWQLTMRVQTSCVRSKAPGFTQVILLRGALYRALGASPELAHDDVVNATFRALDPAPSDFMKEAVDSGPGHERAVKAMTDLLEYRLLEDLARAWRVAQPNLDAMRAAAYPL